MSLLAFGCGAKDNAKNAQYYYDHPEEVKTAIQPCENKAKTTSDADLDTLKNDKDMIEQCESVILGAQGIMRKNLKLVLMEKEKYGWSAYIDYVKKSRVVTKQREEAQKQREESQKKREEEEKAKVEADKKSARQLAERAKELDWVTFINDEEFKGMCTKGREYCDTLKKLMKEKREEGEKAVFAMRYDELLSQKSTLCPEVYSPSCEFFTKAKYELFEKEVSDYVTGDEVKLRADYKACQKNVTQYNFYKQNEKYIEAEKTYPCPIVRKAAERKFKINLMMDGFKKNLPK